VGFLWIREAGIPVLGKYQQRCAKWEFSKDFRWAFAQREVGEGKEIGGLLG
jgi:hypothetical protein